jgi:hypothetical protein
MPTLRRPLAVAYSTPTRREIRRWLEREGYVRGDRLSLADQDYAARSFCGFPYLTSLALRYLGASWFRTHWDGRLDKRAKHYFRLPRGETLSKHERKPWSRIGTSRLHGRGRGRLRYVDLRSRKKTRRARKPTTLREMNEITGILRTWKREMVRVSRSDGHKKSSKA